MGYRSCHGNRLSWLVLVKQKEQSSCPSHLNSRCWSLLDGPGVTACPLPLLVDPQVPTKKSRDPHEVWRRKWLDLGLHFFKKIVPRIWRRVKIEFCKLTSTQQQSFKHSQTRKRPLACSVLPPIHSTVVWHGKIHVGLFLSTVVFLLLSIVRPTPNAKHCHRMSGKKSSSIAFP